MKQSSSSSSSFSVAVVCAKRMLRSKHVYVWLVLVVVLYFTITGFLSGLLSGRAALSHTNEPQANIDQINKLKERIRLLEDSLENSKKNAQELNKLIKSVYNELNETLGLSDGSGGGVNENGQRARKGEGGEVEEETGPPIAVLVMACNRAKSVESHVNQLIKNRDGMRGGRERFPIIVSQDCGDQETARTIDSFGSQLFASIKQPDLSEIRVDSRGEAIQPHMQGYFKISRHYKWALDQAFVEHKFEAVVITEDDLNVAPDFLAYFAAMHKVLVADPTLYCVSAWNDNGKKSLIDTSRSNLVHRSDFFPGLGWMLRRTLWLELRDKWPEAFWDDWIRDHKQRQDRACLRPEISRTQMAIEFAKKGVSQGQFFDKFLSQIVLNKNPVEWSGKDISSLIKKNYDPVFLEEVYSGAAELRFGDYLRMSPKTRVVHRSIRIPYASKEEFLTAARYFDIMDDFKDGVPRTAYRGVVTLYFDAQTVYLAPAAKLDWPGYDTKW